MDSFSKKNVIFMQLFTCFFIIYIFFLARSTLWNGSEKDRRNNKSIKSGLI